MSDSLKKRFENRAELEPLTDEPLPGHRERFKKRLFEHHERNERPRQLPLWSIVVAAACFCGVIISLVYFNIEKENQFAQEVGLSDMSTEMHHLETWFATEIDTKKGSVDFNDPDIKVHVEKFLFLEQEYQELLEALNNNYGNGQVVSAMIKNYRLRLQVLEQIKQHIELQNRKKTNGNDTSEFNT